MPELPEVETIRLGLERWALDRTIRNVSVAHPRAVRRHLPGADDFRALLVGRAMTAAQRRGKYLWLPLDSGDALVVHLGMSGQLLVVPSGTAPERHLRVTLTFEDGGPDLRFVDQRTFGGLSVSAGGAALPSSIAHIARDPVDPAFDDEGFARNLRGKRTGLKRALLDQTLVSGIGAIYADEALWRCRLHWARPTETMTRPVTARLLASVREVLDEAIAVGGTSFDALYVNVNGRSGYFDRSLNVYGREGEPCPRCGSPIRRAKWMNRSAYWCPTCQRAPRHPHP
ncbi:bifunctional DNA-formamidopyrimidine glycosylase/DNA-(apurinic or apyrimidinic site) lyase [Streptomyces sp. NPDC002889]|uniref:bifunctional DNA-formamidopyrimidine glycosylase/DNA-(apurinic or apyrimidinic site) lyase n=1 Tax=Streptomyces sp. NPDC002889 TaxID=3364669 RepID=UPI0036CB8A0F